MEDPLDRDAAGRVVLINGKINADDCKHVFARLMAATHSRGLTRPCSCQPTARPGGRDSLLASAIGCPRAGGQRGRLQLKARAVRSYVSAEKRAAAFSLLHGHHTEKESFDDSNDARV